MHRQIAYLETSSLINDPSNARTHNAKQIAQIARSIESFGFNNPVLIDRAGKIIAGHGRVLLGAEKAHLVFTDPPYNLPIDGHVSGLGRFKHREFVQASGEMSDNDFNNFLRLACDNMRAVSVDGAINFVCMDWRHIEALIRVGRSVYSELKNVCVWVKPNGGMGSLYRSQHEFVAVFKAGRAPHRNNVQLGASGRYRTNVWAYDGMNSFQAGRADKLAMHPTVKPVGMIGDAYSIARPGEILFSIHSRAPGALCWQQSARAERAERWSSIQDMSMSSWLASPRRQANVR